MNHVLSTHVFANHRLTSVWLDKIWDAGIPQVELFCARQHLDWRDRAQVTELGHWFRDAELKVFSVHSPMYTDEVWGRSGPQSVITITDTTKGKRIAMVDEIKRVLEIAEIIPFRYMVQHIGVGDEEYDERKIDAAFSSLEELSLFGRQRGVSILLENIPNRLSTATRLVNFLEYTHLDLNFVFDTGHANIEGSVESEFDIMKGRVRSTHVHDNDGVNDSHLFPTITPGGKIDWKRVMPMLAAHGEKFPLLLELKERPEYPNPLEAIKQIFVNLEQLATAEVEK